MKHNRMYCFLIAVLVVAAAIFSVACNRPVSGNEVGEYYHDYNGNEYLLTLSEGCSFVLKAPDEKKGSYTLEDETLTLKSGGETITGRYYKDEIAIKIGEETLLFIRRTPFTVTFDSNGGSTVPSQTVINGRKAERPTPPIKDNALFGGWYSDAGLKTLFDFDSGINADTKLYAKWIDYVPGAEEFNIDFYLYEGADAMPAITTVGGHAVGIQNPVRSKYIFRGWWISNLDDITKPSYKFSEDMTFYEDTTLIALWRSAESTAKLQTPEPDLKETNTSLNMSWAHVEKATSYIIEVTDADGNSVKYADGITALSYSIDASLLEPGDYKLTLTAVAASPVNNSTAERWFRYKALPRVSHFDIEGNVISFSPIAGAEEYFLSINCGNSQHLHTRLPLGDKTSYDFGNCPMKEGGIDFTVIAAADDKAESHSRTFNLNRSLAAITDVSINSAEDTISWAPIPNAQNYVVTMTIGKTESTVTVTEPTCSLKTLPSGNITVGITAYADGYNPSTAAMFRYRKTTLATPDDVRLEGYTLVWSAVNNAQSYEVEINGETKSFTDPSVKITDEFTLNGGENISIRVRAVGSTVSQWSDEISAKLNTVTDLQYQNGTLSWDYVLGATSYEVTVGDVTSTVTTNSTQIEFPSDGEITLRVRSYDGQTYSDPASITVTAYKLTFDAGNAITELYKATGDSVTLPGGTKRGFDLDSWYSTQQGPADAGKRYGSVGDSFVFKGSENTRIYAYWLAKVYFIKYDYNGKTVDESLDGKQVEFNSEYSLDVPVSTDKEYVFAGWFLESSAQTLITDATGISSELFEPETFGDENDKEFTVYARWLHVFEFTVDSTTGNYKVAKGPDIGELTEITVPEYTGANKKPITIIPNVAFINLTNLKVINIPDTLTEIQVQGFEGCTSLTDIKVYRGEGKAGEYRDKDGILVDTFSGNTRILFFPAQKATEYTIPEGVTEIGVFAFNGTALTSITFPKSLRFIRNNAFGSCSALRQVNFATGGALTMLDSYAFENCTALTNLVIPQGVTEFGPGVFQGCNMLVSITINGNVNTIPENAFYGCSKLQELRIPDSVTEIGAAAFQNCSELASIAIGRNVNNISDNAFRDCTNLNSVTFGGTMLTAIGASAFEGCANLVNPELPASLRTISNRAFYNCKSITKITVPALTNVGSQIFFLSSGSVQTEITLTDGLTEIGANMFTRRMFRSITIPDSVTKINESAFFMCTDLKDIVLPSGLKEIQKDAFFMCSLSRIFYKGASKEDLRGITIDSSNTTILNAINNETPNTTPILFCLSESPIYDGFHWRYVDGKPEPWENQ